MAHQKKTGGAKISWLGANSGAEEKKEKKEPSK